MTDIKINAYICPELHITVTKDENEEGVTPFVIVCPKCQKHARSQMHVVNQSLKPTHEWYIPNNYDGLGYHEIEYVKSGGLLLREIVEQ